MSVLAITAVSLRRYLRDRLALFFLLVLPVLLIIVVGTTVRGFSTFKVGVVDLGAGPAGAQLTAALRGAPDLDVRALPTTPAARSAVARGEVATAIVLPRGMDAALRRGAPVTLEVLAERTDSTQQAAAAAVRSVVASEGARIQAARFADAQAGGGVDANLARARVLQPTIAQVAVGTRVVGSGSNVLPEGFSYSAPTMLVLFVFLNAVAGGAAIIENRRLGMYERMAAAPVSSSAIVGGETLTYVAIALVQSVLIVAIAAVAFGVSWGSPLAAVVLVVLWALVGAGAGLLSGTLFKTPEQATAIGPAVGIAFAMLGGCMWPLAIVSGAMRAVGHVTPHAWAVDAWTDLLSRGGTVASIAPDLAVLAGFAALFLGLATLRLRRVLS